LLQHEISIAVQVGIACGNVFLKLLDACFLVGFLFVVVGFLFDKTLDRLGCDGKGRRGCHFGYEGDSQESCYY